MKRIRSERGCHVVWTFLSKQFVAVVLPTRDAQADRTTRVAMVNGGRVCVRAVIGGSMSASSRSGHSQIRRNSDVRYCPHNGVKSDIAISVWCQHATSRRPSGPSRPSADLHPLRLRFQVSPSSDFACPSPMPRTGLFQGAVFIMSRSYSRDIFGRQVWVGLTYAEKTRESKLLDAAHRLTKTVAFCRGKQMISHFPYQFCFGPNNMERPRPSPSCAKGNVDETNRSTSMQFHFRRVCSGLRWCP